MICYIKEVLKMYVKMKNFVRQPSMKKNMAEPVRPTIAMGIMFWTRMNMDGNSILFINARKMGGFSL